MRNQMRIILSVLVLGAAAVSVPDTALAGRGSSYSQVVSAIQTQNADVIISELERSERLICVKCVAPVMQLLDSDDYRIREAAAWWFARRPAQKEEIHDLGVARLYGDDAVAARNAADWLGTFRHPKALSALQYAATRTDFPAETRVAIVRAIGTIGVPAGEGAIVAAFADSDASVRVAALGAYFELRGERDGAPVAGLLRDGAVEVRRDAAGLIGQYRTASARVELENLVAGDADSLVRRNAAWSLGRIGDAASRSVLEQAAQNDPSSLVRGVAKASLALLR